MKLKRIATAVLPILFLAGWLVAQSSGQSTFPPNLYAVYQEAEEGFAGKYLDMLAAGGTRRHKELLAPFGLDASDPAFWAKGLGVVRGFIDELERM